ncbi:hypothetical protein NCAS_0H00180 [Naumovozyma castellii]|uniref:Pyridoxamine 5'-phosphate oxidase N-terminal domain-containing protein n=1 Tax=Naumovozyma castellii TaxID=27288 RepID=G0VIK3_NAUCA|nr:hypothetical protein NCAS_0H00180 [Naumovozyma castellii CBS 4309]CCC71328.1 hypothetical protein NCAS_0H00180 [Naumovozyma castellii CBS 4309]
MSSPRFPAELTDLIKTSKYVHVATCSNAAIPSIALMNYIYVPKKDSFRPNVDKRDYIIFATSEDSEKYDNILANPTIALLFHDWITANNLSIRKTDISTDSDTHVERLNNLLEELNQDELNQISATIRGKAHILNSESKESTYYRHLLLKSNPDADIFILGENTATIKVEILSAKVTDSENNKKSYL